MFADTATSSRAKRVLLRQIFLCVDPISGWLRGFLGGFAESPPPRISPSSGISPSPRIFAWIRRVASSEDFAFLRDFAFSEDFRVDSPSRLKQRTIAPLSGRIASLALVDGFWRHGAGKASLSLLWDFVYEADIDAVENEYPSQSPDAKERHDRATPTRMWW